MTHKILITGLTIAFPMFNIWAEPGGSYILTGNEKSIAEIVEADMARYPELYKGENPKIYLGRFKHKNGIGIGPKRKLRPGDRLYFPETRVSTENNEAKLAKEKKQKEEERQAIYASFIEKLETDWINMRAFRELDSKLKRKGFWEEHWPTEIDGRCSQNGEFEFKLKCEVVPIENRYGWSWCYYMDEKEFEKVKRQNQGKGLAIVHEQSFTISNGEKRYQAVWRMHEG